MAMLFAYTSYKVMNSTDIENELQITSAAFFLHVRPLHHTRSISLLMYV
jgi:hypothetical protein